MVLLVKAEKVIVRATISRKIISVLGRGGVVADSEVELRRWADSTAIAIGDTGKRVEQGRT
jgi:hypothetical protein